MRIIYMMLLCCFVSLVTKYEPSHAWNLTVSRYNQLDAISSNSRLIDTSVLKHIIICNFSENIVLAAGGNTAPEQSVLQTSGQRHKRCMALPWTNVKVPGNVYIIEIEPSVSAKIEVVLESMADAVSRRASRVFKAYSYN